VDQFRVRPLIQRDLFGLERHAADRTASGTDLPDLGMHRTGVDRACRRRGLSLSRLEEFFRLNLEAFAASCAAEENFPLAIFEAVLCSTPIYVHGADTVHRALPLS